MPFARQNLLDSELLIVLYQPELRGGLIEAGMAYAQEIPIWLCHETGERVSSSMRGCTDVTIEYESLDELQMKLNALLQRTDVNVHATPTKPTAVGSPYRGHESA